MKTKNDLQGYETTLQKDHATFSAISVSLRDLRFGPAQLFLSFHLEFL